MVENGKKNTKRILIIIGSIILALFLLMLSFCCGFLTSCVIGGKTAGTIYSITSIMDNVGYIYDPVTGEKRELTEKDYADALVNAFLDEYSKYYTPEEYKKELEESRGSYTGVGVGFYYAESTVLSSVVCNSPAYKGGLRAGDKILSGSCNGVDKSFTNALEIIAFLTDCPDFQDIKLTVEGKGEVTVLKTNYYAAYVTYYDSQTCYEFVSDYGKAPVGTARAKAAGEFAEITDDEVAYIKFDLFEANAAVHLGQALNYMKSQGRTKLVLDIRNNGGGYMDVLTEVASYFIHNGGKKKSVVAYAIDNSDNREVFATSANRFKSFITSMSVIANHNTASASECLLGALLTYGELVSSNDKVILEEHNGVAKTYGKGIMQTTYMLLNGGAFKLTTAKIYWPDATTSIHGKGFLDGTKATKDNAITVAISKL